jgi:hypothetical protein
MSLRMRVSVGLMCVCLLGVGCKKKLPVAADLYNDAAKVDAGLPYPVMEWRALTTSVDRGMGTTSTLFGNDAAVTAARAGQPYAAGAVLGLVTWRQKDDPHWFGARIPDAPAGVEFVEYGPGLAPVYRHFAGTPMVEEQADSGGAQRIAAIEGMKVARLP